MLNTVAYPYLALEKFIEIDSSEEPTAFIRLLDKKISFSLGSRPTKNWNNIENVYDDRRKDFFGSVLRGPTAEWFDSLEAALTWDKTKTQFFARENAVPISNRSWNFEKTARREHQRLYTQKKH